MNYAKSNYKKIDKIVKKIGWNKTNTGGIYEKNGKTIDLTASGSEEWMIYKNILSQI